MLFPKFAEGLESVLFIALNSGANPVSSKQICTYQDVLPRHLESVLQALVKEGILKGTKGPRGGYTLAKEKRKISVADIFIPLNKEPSLRKKEPSTKHTSIKKIIIKKINDEIAKNLESSLSQITIEDLCKQVEDKTKKSNKADFNI